MSIIAVIIEISKLAICALILFYVVEMLTAMPPNIRRVVQMLIILIAILASLQIALASSTSAPPPRRDMSLGGVPSIIVPERR